METDNRFSMFYFFQNIVEPTELTIRFNVLIRKLKIQNSGYLMLNCSY